MEIALILTIKELAAVARAMALLETEMRGGRWTEHEAQLRPIHEKLAFVCAALGMFDETPTAPKARA